MGLDVSETESHIQDGPRSKIVHHSPHSRAKVDEKDIKALLKSRYNNLRRLDENYRELRLSNSVSPRRKSMPARPHVANAKNSEVVNRGSVYQSSREVRSMRKLRESRRNVEPAFSNESSLSFEIVDALPSPSLNEALGFPWPKRSPLLSLDAKSTTLADIHPSIPVKSTEFLELSFRDLSEERVKFTSSCSGSASTMDSLKDRVMEISSHSKEKRGKGSLEEQKFGSNQMFRKQTDGNILSERETLSNLSKSLSAKAVIFNSPCKTERETSKDSPKSRFSPFKKMLDPIMKSRSLRNPSLVETEIGGSIAVNPPSIKRHRVFDKSLLNDLSKATENTDVGSIERDQVSTKVSSPAHLHAILKLDCKHGASSYEFMTNDPEDVLWAKTWRTDSAFNWVYTLHSCKKKRNNSSGWGSKGRHVQSPPMVGQMQVSCYLCSEVNSNGSLETSTVTEFVLYDIAQARRSFAIEEASRCPSDSTQPPNFTSDNSLITVISSATSNSMENEKYQYRHRHPSSDFESDPSTSYPCSLADLHPCLQIAAIVIQIPFNKNEEKELKKEHQNLPSAPATHQGNDRTFDCMDCANVKVVTPSGTHGLPSTEEGRPSSLLDRWRFGGGCDCGGWDMACPIVVLDSPCASNDVADHSAKGSQQQMVLLFQGRKEKIPALSITYNGEGQYSVDFHAQLSSLQAFSICISILRSSEAASALGQENKQRLHSNSITLLFEEEMRHLLESVAEEEKRKAKEKIEHLPPTFILDSPFSPMGRV